MKGFLEWARLSIANVQPEKTVGPWAHREVGLAFPSMNGKARTKRILWNRRCGRLMGPEADPDSSSTLDPANPVPGRCSPVVVRCLPVRLTDPLKEGGESGKEQ